MGNICTHCLLELKAPIQQKAQQPLQLVAVGPQKLNRLAGLCSCSCCLWFGGEREAVRRTRIWGIRLVIQPWRQRSPCRRCSKSPEVLMQGRCRPMNCQVKVLKARWLCFNLGLMQPSLKSVGVFPLTSVGFGWPRWGFLAPEPWCCREPDARRGRSSCAKLNHRCSGGQRVGGRRGQQERERAAER